MMLDENASIEKVYKLEQQQQKEHYKTLVEMGKTMLSSCYRIGQYDF